MGSCGNILIVEDEDEWCGIYLRAVNALGAHYTIKVAKDLAGAEELIEAAKFAVAFVDVGLDVSDDRNVDGLRVMGKIRAMHDETSIVVVTGRSGQDVLSITRDAIKKYDAYDTVGKSTVRPSDIRRLLEGGLEAYMRSAPRKRMDVREALRGEVNALIWDNQIMKATQFEGDAGRFYDFLNDLVGDYLPLVERSRDKLATTVRTTDAFCADYWSRGITAAVLVCFAGTERFAEVAGHTRTHSTLFARYAVDDPIREVTYHGLKGAVFELQECRAVYDQIT